MKSLLFILVLVSSVSAFAQKHMVEVGSNSLTSGSFRKETDGSDSEQFSFAGSYAYQFSTHQQVAVRASYYHDGFGSGHYDSETISAGLIHNFQDDVKRSLYASLYAGMGWADGSYMHSQEYFHYALAVGKRISLAGLGLENVTYSPEISWIKQDATSSEAENSYLQITYIQFSLFF